MNMYRTTIGMWVAVISLTGVCWAKYGDGVGSDTQPYQIGTLGHWQTLMNTPEDWDKHFVLTANLDFNGLQLTPIGNTITMFTGIFDGQRFKVQNAVINAPNNDNVGLFGKVGYQYTGDGYIMNLGVENIHVTGRNLVGGLVGSSAGTIIACYVTGNVSGNNTVGGLCGYSDNLISACYTSVEVNGYKIIGGLAGDGFVVYNSYATGDVIAPGGVAIGGLLGCGHVVVNCYATGSVRASSGSGVGGLCGGEGSRSLSNSFWDIETSGMIYSLGGTGLHTAAMQNAEPYLRAYWDFVGEVKNGTQGIWFMPPEGGYPLLFWQVLDLFVLPNDDMVGATAITIDSSIFDTTDGAKGLDITLNGYNDCLDVWYAFDCVETARYTITLKGDFDTTLAVFDSLQREIVFNDEFFGGKSQVILNAKSGHRYYIRVAGKDAQTGFFELSVTSGTVQAIQGDLNYDGKVNLIDLAIIAQNWLVGTED